MCCLLTYRTQKMKFSIQDFFSNCDQIRSKLRIWSHLLTKSLVLSKSLVHCKMVQKSGFCYDRRNKKMQVCQQFLVDLVPAVCNFVINETLTYVFYWEFCQLFSVCNFIKNKTPARVFLRVSRNFSDCKLKTLKTRPRHILKILKNFSEQLFGEHLRRVASTDVIIARFSCKIYCSLK